ncbi:hypothetical protein SDC9_168157 [bioreactor metagenome]|uniref:Uncharacterized protein n=1 Tax=bioreactor metagenome TaxID=1076179 RepID=A0A645G1R9_9ZZZZ
MIVDHGGKQVVCSAYGMKISREMKVDVFHRNDLRISAAGRAAFDTENRPEGRFSERDNDVFTQTRDCVAYADGRRRFSFSGRRRIDRRRQNQLCFFPGTFCRFQKIIIYFCFVLSVKF